MNLVYLRDPGELVVGPDPDRTLIQDGKAYAIYKLTPGQMRNLAKDAVRIALDKADQDSQVGAPFPD